MLSDEVPAAIERLQAESKEHRRSLAALHLELAHYRANELADAAEPTAVGRLVLRAIDDDAAGLKSMAAAVATRSGHVAVLVSTSRPALVVVARSPDVSLAANEIVRTLTTKFGGRGGGKPDLAQAGGLEADAGAILSAARSAIAGSTISPKGKG